MQGPVSHLPVFVQLNSISADSYTYNPAKQTACQHLARHKRTNLANDPFKMKPPNHRSPIPLYPVPPIPPNSRPKCQSRNSSELSDGFPPIRILKTPPLASSSSIPAHSRYMKTGLGDKNVLNLIDLKAPALNVMVSFHSGFKLAGVLI